MAAPDRFALAWLVAWSLLLNSLPAHKEFRFLLPALQLLMPYAGAAVAQLVEALRTSMHDHNSQRTAPSARAADEALLSEGHVHGDGAADTLHASGQGATSGDGDDHTAAGKVLRRVQPIAGSTMLPGSARQRTARSSGAAASQDAVAQNGAVLQRQPDRRTQRGRRRRLMLAAAAVLCLGAQLLAAAYFCLMHQRCDTQDLTGACSPAHPSSYAPQSCCASRPLHRRTLFP